MVPPPAQDHLRLQQVGLHIRKRGHPEGEGEIVVEGAEFAAVVGAARGGLQQEGIGLVGRPPDGAGVVHGKNSSFMVGMAKGPLRYLS